MDDKFGEVLNLGFRAGANARALAGLPLSSDNEGPSEIPKPPPACQTIDEQEVWVEGFKLGFRIGASDDELASVDDPGAHGMIKSVPPFMVDLSSEKEVT